MENKLAEKEREIQWLQDRVIELERQLDEATLLARLPGENPNPVVRASEEGIVLYCNPPSARLPGWRCEINERLPIPLRHLVQQALIEGYTKEQDVLLGGRIYAVSTVPIPGKPYANVYGRDITEHKMAEDALRESERRQREIARLLELDQARLATILTHLPVGVWIVDQQGRLTGNNPEADRIWAGEGPLLNGIADYQQYVSWHPESGELLKPEEYPIAVALRTGEPVEPMEINIRRFNGSEGTVLVSAVPIKDPQGHLMGVVAVNVDISEHKKAEQALRQSEERLAKAFHATPDAIIISRLLDGLIIEANEGWRKLFGHDPEEVIGQTSIELGIYVNPEDRQELIDRLHEKGFLHDFEIQVRRKSGEVRQVSMAVERLEINGVDFLLTIMRDITERKQAEKAVRESEWRLKRAQEIAHLGSWELDLTNNQLTWSDEVYRIFGLQPQQFAATYEAFLEAVHPEDRAAVDAAYSASIQAGRDSYEIEHRVVRSSSNEVRIVHEKCEHFRNQDGQMIRSVGMVHDITERKHAEEALRKSEERFHSLADSMPQLVWTALPDGTVDYYNQRHQEYKDITKVQAGGWDWAPVLHSDDIERTVTAWQESVETGEVYQIEHRVRMADESYRWHLSRGIPLFGEKGQLTRWYGTSTDIHDLKLAEEKLKDYAERLERSNRELEQFAFMASHDLQEPLRKIEMFSDLLMERAADLNERDRNYLDRMRNAAGRMREMVKGLLELSRVNTQGQRFVPVELSQIVSDVLVDLENQIRRTGGRVGVEPLPAVEGDPVQLRQLMQNLIGNALKYHQPKAQPDVKVHAKRINGNVQIFVEDRGIGFSPEDAERIFQPFQRLVGLSEYEGSGIGLSICRRIVERHAGNITAVSVPGQGTTFVVTLPAAHPEKQGMSKER